MSDYIDPFNYPITKEAAIEVASNLRSDDRREIEEGWGLDPMDLLIKSSQDPSAISFMMPNGKTAGLAGVDDGLIWMVCTPVIHDYPLTFTRRAKRFVESRTAPLLWNIVDKRNTAHLKLLKFLGFKFLRELKHGPNQLSFIEFCRVRRS